MLKIAIPKPCHENWDKMTPETQGRFCGSCAKTVVDFTTMSDEEVQLYLINKTGEKLCGRFNNKQLDRIVIDLPENIFILRIPYWKKFLAACLIVFSTTLFSCETRTSKATTGVMLMEPTTMGEPPVQPTTIGDTTISTCRTDIDLKAAPPISVVMGGLEPRITIQGDIDISPIQPVQPPDEIVAPVIDTLPERFFKGEVSVKPVKDSLPPKKCVKPLIPDNQTVGMIAIRPDVKQDPPKKEKDCDKKTYY